MSAIPLQLKAAEAVAQQLALTGSLPLSRLPRLKAALAGAAQPVTVSLAFAGHPAALGRVRGEVTGTLPLTCQRTLEAFDWPLTASFDWLLARDEAEEERLLADADPVLLDGGLLRLTEAIEDEILLALPLIPLSPGSAAGLRVRAAPAGGQTKPGPISDNRGLDDTRPNPFAALKGKLPRR
jgi:uncharacterized protein